MKLAHQLLAPLLIAALAPAVRARAQDERYPIVIRGEEEISSFSLRTPAGATVVERCREPCRLMLPRGKFRLELLDSEGSAHGTRSVGVDRSAMWTATPQDTTKRDLGLGLAIGGLVLLNVGAVLFLTNTGMHSSQSDAEATAAGIGLLSVIGGAIATPIGFATFFSNLRPRLEVEPLEAAPR